MEQNSNNKTNPLKILFLPITATLDFIQKYFKAIIFLLIVLLLFGVMQKEQISQPNLMEISLDGAILDAKTVLEQIEEAQDENIKGVLFVVNSPGGAVAPSVEISYAIKRLREKKPVVAYAAGTMASGSYYASIWANKIIANPGSTIGSIGVIFEAPNLQKLLDKIGIEPQVVKAGRYKEVGTPFRKWSELEKEELKKVISNTYKMFTTDVAKARGLDLNNSSQWADAHIFTAYGAKQVGLIDAVGTQYEAKKAVEKLAHVKKAVWKKPSEFEKMLKRVTSETSSKLLSLLFGGKLF
ncbi:signal peptide peptidase SppA [Nitratiruptor tergarcus]|uniref:Protease-4 n=1 Tax=Nitratiruptor tergarcus DSM 16512 TaxID=1069081 RepID=A0A1W1WS85_9BACT|nr:signal peptide peptidase SppA [Nitratiruptor tergarcus]SMC09106.1 protease-4 [Nitratiruptor tergarcus DSM 16512]